jgi:hypothetical protein
MNVALSIGRVRMAHILPYTRRKGFLCLLNAWSTQGFAEIANLKRISLIIEVAYEC